MIGVKGGNLVMGCPNLREEIVGRHFLISAGRCERTCTSCGQSIDKEYAKSVCYKDSEYKKCNKYRGPVNSYKPR